MAETADTSRGPIVLCIIDGWGLSPTWRGNAINFSNPPMMQQLWREYPHTVLQAFQPKSQTKRRQIGSSEISHAMIGAGRVVQSDLEEISDAIQAGTFAKNPTLTETFARAKQKQHTVHLVGLASDGGIHSDLTHLYALLGMAKSFDIKQLYLHLITDGRDTPPNSGNSYVQKIQAACTAEGIGTIATLVGRYYAMDRDHHWDRTLAAYRLWTEGHGILADTIDDAFRTAYEQGISDEFLPPQRLAKLGVAPMIHNNDIVICWNSRSDRLRQLVRSFVDPSALRPVLFRQAPVTHLDRFVTLVSPHLDREIPIEVAFPPGQIQTTLPEIISGRRLKQLRVAETEKYAHITYFFNGGREAPFPGEDRLLIPSPRVESYDQVPGMATELMIQRVKDTMKRTFYDFVVMNIANVDLVGHTGNLFATAEAITVADRAIGNLAEFILSIKGTLIITSDHGNAEQMLELPGTETHRAHTVNPVPFILVQSGGKRDLVAQAVTAPPTMLADMIRTQSTLADVAPTILQLFDFPIPSEMTGRSLFERMK